MIRRIVIFLLFATVLVRAQTPHAQGHTVVIMPFENESKAPGLEWIGEAFPEVLGERLGAAGLLLIGRDDRLRALDRVGIPGGVRPSRATLYRIAQELDADYTVLGSFTYDGQTFAASAQLLDVKQLKLLPEAAERGPLPNVLEVETTLAWDLLRQLDESMLPSKNAFLAAAPAVRLDAFENYIRGITAGTREERIRRLREAVRLTPNYTRAIFQLGKNYFAMRDYDNAAVWLGRVPHNDVLATEASFYEGLADYYLSQFEKSEAAFTFLAGRLPLTEVYNNLGVVAGRRGRHEAVGYFQKAVQADPGEPDYHFNLAVALGRSGDASGAARQLREALTLHPTDAEAKTLLDSLAAGQTPAKLPLERIKRNYDETSFRQLAQEIENATEARLAQSQPEAHAQAHVERGRQLLGQGFAGEAEKQFREAVLLDPVNAAAHLGLAMALESGDAAAARKELATAIQLTPSAEAFVLLARLDLRDNHVQAAADDVGRALALEPGNAAAQLLQREIAARGTATPRP